MKLSDFLFKPTNPETMDKMFKKIKNDCSDFLLKSNNGSPSVYPLYRGSNSMNMRKINYEKPRSDRKLKDSKLSHNVVFETYLKQKFGVDYARTSNVFFLTRNVDIAWTYGVSFYAFPVNGTEMIYSNDVEDSLVLLNELEQFICETIKSHLPKKSKKDFSTLLDILVPNGKYPRDFFNFRYNADIYLEIINTLCEKFRLKIDDGEKLARFRSDLIDIEAQMVHDIYEYFDEEDYVKVPSYKIPKTKRSEIMLYGPAYFVPVKFALSMLPGDDDYQAIYSRLVDQINKV